MKDSRASVVCSLDSAAAHIIHWAMVGISHRLFCVQTQITEARVHAERALASKMQSYAVTAGLTEWAGQTVGIDQSDSIDASAWFGGLELSAEVNSSASASVNVELVEPGVDFIEVRQTAQSCRP